MPPEPAPYIYVTAPAELPAVLDHLHRHTVVAVDSETTGLDPHADRLRLVQLATSERTYILDAFRLDLAPLRPWFVDPSTTRIIQYATFDVKFLYAAGIEVATVWDPMLASQVLSAGQKEVDSEGKTREIKHSLKALAERYLGLSLSKKEQTSDWGGELTEDQLAYAAKDARTLLALYDVLREKIAADRLDRVVRIENDCALAVAWMGYHGVPFDVGRWTALVEKAEADQRAAIEELERLREQLIPEGQFLPMAVKWSSNPQTLAFLRANGIDGPDTEEETLAPHKDHPVVAALLPYRNASTRIKSYGRDWIALLSPKTGRLHPDWRQIGSVAGRMSCKKPQLQGVPRNPAYRACFAAPEGRVLLKADFSQVELRIGAEIAGDATLIRAYREGRDVHSLTAQRVTGKAEVTKAERQLAKAVNFGLLFGAGAETLQLRAATDYGVTMSLDEADRFRRTFFATYRGIAAWHQKARDSYRTTTETRTLAGRRRLFPEGQCGYTQWLNSPVQGSGGDAIKIALGLLWQRRELCPGAFPVLAVHDEIVVEAPTEGVEAARSWLLGAMHDALASILSKVPPGDLDVRSGPDWSMQEVANG